MKKLMVAACAVAFAAAAQAASVNWDSGDFVTLESCTGFTTCDNEGIQMLVWEFAAENWNTDYEDGAKLFAAYQAGDLGAATAVGQSDSMWGTVAVDGASTWADGQTVKAAVLFLHNDEQDFDNPDYYMANYGTAEAAEAGGNFSNLGNAINDGATETSWTAAAVPEPTSGLLLLLGVAGLALRRRRA